MKLLILLAMFAIAWIATNIFWYVLSERFEE